MTVSSSVTEHRFLGNGVTRRFPFTFPVREAGWVKVEVDSEPPAVAVVTLRSDGKGGSVELAIAPALDAVVRVFRLVPLVQLTDYVGAEAWPADVHEANLDQAIMAAQGIAARLVFLESGAGAELRATTPVLEPLPSVVYDELIVTGAADPGAEVTLTANGVSVGLALADTSGRFSARLLLALTAGYVISCTATVPEKSRSLPAAAQVVTVLPIPAPTLDEIASPSSGVGIAVSGTALPGATVRVRRGYTASDPLLVATLADGAGVWSATLPDLPVGTHTLCATAQLTRGESVVSNLRSVEVQAAFQPTIGPAGYQGIIIAWTVGDVLAVGGECLRTATLVEYQLDGGAWTTPPDIVRSSFGARFDFSISGLAGGEHTLLARSTDPIFGVVTGAAPFAFTLDTGKSAPPVLTAPAAGAYVKTEPVVFTGTGVVGATISLAVDGGAPQTATVDGGGAWSISVAGIAGGPHTISVTQTDTVATKTVSDPVTRSFTIDRVAPAVPVITQPANGAQLGSGTANVSGTAEANALVRLYLDNVALAGDAQASGTGAWQKSVTWTPGAHTLKAEARDAAGNLSAQSAAITVSVDTPTATPTLTQPVSPTNADPIPITGTAEAGATVYVYRDGVKSSYWGVAQSNGAFSIGLRGPGSVPLATGSYSITVTAQSATRAESAQSAARTLVVDRVAPAVPVLAAIASPTNANPVVATGTCDPSTAVDLYAGAALVTSVVTDGAGAFTANLALAEGTHSITAKSRDAIGNTRAASAARSVVVDRTAPALTIGIPDGVSSTNLDGVSGTGEAGATVTVKFDGVTIGTAVVGAAGEPYGALGWFLDTRGVSAADGPHTLEASVPPDLAGNTAVITRAITVDRTAPDAPVITSPADGEVTAFEAVSGTGTPGNEVWLYLNGSLAPGPAGQNKATVAGDGTWTITPVFGTPPVGLYDVAVGAFDVAGNKTMSQPVSVTIDPDLAAFEAMLPAPEPGKYLVWNPTGAAFVNVTASELLDGMTPTEKYQLVVE